MASGFEAFLINPKRRRRSASPRRRIGTTRRKRTGLPSPLLRRMMKTYGPAQGMKRAWAEFRKGVRRNPWPDHAAVHRRAALKGWGIKRRTRTVSRRRKRNPWATLHYKPRTLREWRVGSTGRFGKRVGHKNPFGEEVMIVGNPRRRRTRRHRRISSLFGNRSRVRRHRRRHYALNPRRRHYRRYNRVRRHRRSYAMNPRRHYRRYRHNARRHYRRNPASSGSLPAISFRNPMGILMPAVMGTAGFLASSMLPPMLGTTFSTTYMRFAAKAGIVVGGGMVLGKFMGKKNGLYFAIGAGIGLLTDILNTYVFKTTPVSGVGAFPYQMGAYPGDTFGDVGIAPYGEHAPAYGSGYPF